MLTTINRTALSYAAAIVGAEYILRLVKPGTHDWNKFVTVEELSDLMSESKLLSYYFCTAIEIVNPFLTLAMLKRIGHFRVHLSFLLKARLSATSLL